MPPTGGYRTSLSWQARYGPLGQGVSDAVFSPGQPLAPPAQEPVRVWDFPVGVNSTITPRAAEPFGFAHLRAFSNVELVRLAIETRKDQLEGLHWRFNPRDDAQPGAGGLDARIQRLTQFCGGRGQCVRSLAAAGAGGPAGDRRAGVREVRDRAGRLIGLDVVPGDTIKLLVDETGHARAAGAGLSADHQGTGLGRPHHGRPALRAA